MGLDEINATINKSNGSGSSKISISYIKQKTKSYKYILSFPNYQLAIEILNETISEHYRFRY